MSSWGSLREADAAIMKSAAIEIAHVIERIGKLSKEATDLLSDSAGGTLVLTSRLAWAVDVLRDNSGVIRARLNERNPDGMRISN